MNRRNLSKLLTTVLLLTAVAASAQISGSRATRAIYVGYAEGTVNKTTNETTILPSTGVGTLTLPVSYMTAGTQLRLFCDGMFSAITNQAINVRVKMGTTTIASTGLVLPSLCTNVLYSLVANITIISAGSSGTVACNGWFETVDTTLGTNIVKFPLVNTTTAQSVDMSSTKAVNATIQFPVGTLGPNSTTNRIVTQTCLLEGTH